MKAVRDPKPACGFCDGTGLWADSDDDLVNADPCPLCEGSGIGPVVASAPDEAPPAETIPPVARLMAVLTKLSQSERQRLYEELFARYDCRIYRS